MPEMNNQNNDRIFIELMGFNGEKWQQKLVILNKLFQIKERSTLIMILSFLIQIEKTVDAPSFVELTLNYHINKLKAYLKRNLPTEFDCIVDKIEYFHTNEAEIYLEDFDENEFIIKYIIEALVTSSSKEIENLITNYYSGDTKHAENDFNLKEKFFVEFFENFAQINNKKIELIISTLDIDDLDVFSRKIHAPNIDLPDILLKLYLFNKNFYDLFKERVFTKKIEKFYEHLPVILEDDIKEENISVDLMKKIALDRPKLRPHLINMLIKKGSASEALIENFDVFKDNLEMLNLPMDDLIKIAGVKEELVIKLVPYVQSKDYDKIISIIVTKPDEFIIKLFPPTLQNTEADGLIIAFLMSKPLSESLKNYFTHFFANNSKYFYALMPYFRREKNLEAFGKYLNDQQSLYYFLRVFSMNEIFYFAHYVPDINKSMLITKLCVENSNFNENVALFALPKMESDSTLPPLFMRSVIICLKRYPGLDKMIYKLLTKLVKKEIWSDTQMLEGFIRVLELLKGGITELLLEMPPNIIAKILKRSRVVTIQIKKYFDDKTDVLDKNERKLRSVLHSVV